jgi:uncharacterized membrane protein YeaQ/YmgE (transglycosylase-associated protein family)
LQRNVALREAQTHQAAPFSSTRLTLSDVAADSHLTSGYHRSLRRNTLSQEQGSAVIVGTCREVSMPFSGESVLVILIVGLIAGWLAGQIVAGGGFGLIGNIVVGVIGAFVAAWLLPRLGIRIGGGVIRQVIDATIGAVILLVVVGLIRRI